MIPITSTFILSAFVLSLVVETSSFSLPSAVRWQKTALSTTTESNDGEYPMLHQRSVASNNALSSNAESRRTILQNAILATAAFSMTSSRIANAAIGTLPEFSDTNAIFQSITIDITDKQQYDDTIAFFLNGFDGCKILRERGGTGGGVVKDTVRLLSTISSDVDSQPQITYLH